ncbi:hypothetical protein Cob_v001396 [Colletotrichum orbiculare MAFF 240422]|uniref:Uncharacterized protein n=1 Tax=Colletotrichum orbiculare (strain 104-T / ATCC 96160 / CBS 514.97 / LARS 414 / MAFF 240422) TaxID=1213857 RepID=A0A484G834_COLOR|nr:hypothetical protein Cob_v001396 [Colletotrichum orbiculare MAFF 240422]
MSQSKPAFKSSTLRSSWSNQAALWSYCTSLMLMPTSSSCKIQIARLTSAEDKGSREQRLSEFPKQQ